jgi:hypothetical protein
LSTASQFGSDIIGDGSELGQHGGGETVEASQGNARITGNFNGVSSGAQTSLDLGDRQSGGPPRRRCLSNKCADLVGDGHGERVTAAVFDDGQLREVRRDGHKTHFAHRLPFDASRPVSPTRQAYDKG